MKRLLTTTTALSVALSSINPVMLQAQTRVQVEGQTVICLPNKQADCPQGATCVVAKNPANCERNARKAVGGSAAAPEEEPQANKPDRKAARAAAKAEAEAAAAEADRVAAEKAARRAAREAAAAEEAARAKAEAIAADKAARVEGEGGIAKSSTLNNRDAKAQAEADEAARKAARKAEREAERAAKAAQEAKEAEAAAAETPKTGKPIRAADGDAAEPEAAGKPAGGKKKRPMPEDTLPVIDTAEGVAPPDVAAVEALSDILTDEEPEPEVRANGKAAKATAEDQPRQKKRKKPAAADVALTEDPSPEAKITRNKVTKEDTRRSDEDFDTRALSPEATLRDGEQPEKTAKKRDKLSNLEKAGLVVLGALVVGSLLKNGDRVVSNTGDRVVVDRGDGQYVVLKDDDTLIRQPGSDVRTETFRDGSTRTIVDRADGTQIVTIRDASGRVLRRARVNLDGSQTLLIDDLSDQVEEVDFATLPRPKPGGLIVSTSGQDAALRAAMLKLQAEEAGRSFSLSQIRDYREVRALAPMVDVDSVTFETGSAAIRPSEAQKLAELGAFMTEMIAENAGELFLIEGHTDAVGGGAYNLALSDRRAESLALALTEYFDVPPENMVVQGYGESELRVASEGDEPRNRRAVVRMISPLMQQLAAR
ncbi:OmpA family protein [Gemmobacter fulvus]|uniref:OmpA family protein n=1 Tax=Gemmobacter fulvus TaxID=2840474 RepID=A0A975S1Y3_9RHOB|nr:OmpA family protein [Gemmobacter fulvus]MBT9243880.1 OmpA family protein [Gemmobacter fulvus]QWK90801.1 OmpA family protein [Gemmobacter fulvus]